VPEGDTIHRTAAALDRALGGHVVIGFETALAQVARVHDDTPITGRTIERCEAIGKHVLMHFSGGLDLRTHMRMSGSWHLYRPGERWRRPRQAMRVKIETDSWVAVAFDVPVAEFLRASDLGRHPTLSALGPDLLSPELDREEAVQRLAAAGPRPIADVLLDQRVLAGIGNIFKSEVLFVCRVHPDTPSTAIDDQTRRRIVDTAVRLMRANVDHASGAIVTYRSLRGLTRGAGPGDTVWVYGRAGRPCRRCGTPIRSVKRPPDARTTYWCPACQALERNL
jgi:endonuclease-8